MAERAVHTPRLPAGLCREIGRIITRWAYLENYLQYTLWMLMGISEKEGRLALREPRLTERLELIEDLAHLYGLKPDTALLKTMKTEINKTVEIRDAMAHGPWSYDATHHMWAVTITKQDHLLSTACARSAPYRIPLARHHGDR